MSLASLVHPLEWPGRHVYRSVDTIPYGIDKGKWKSCDSPPVDSAAGGTDLQPLSIYTAPMGNETNSRDAILGRALELFARRGYDGVGVAQVAEAAGVTKPTLYYFFHSKEGLLAAVLEEQYASFNHALAEACVYEPHPHEYGRDVRPALLRVVQLYYSAARTNTDFYLLRLSLSFAPPDSAITRMAEPYMHEQYAIVTRLFHDIGACHGGVRGRELSCAAHLVAMLNADVAFWHQGRGSLDDDQAEATVRQFMHGIFS